MPLLLASASPRRRELLAALGVEFAVQAADVPEPLVEGMPADEQARRLALAKAQAGARTAPGAAVLGADTIVVLDGVPLGKPADAEEARRMLRDLCGRDHEVITGVALILGVADDVAPAGDGAAGGSRARGEPAAGRPSAGEEPGTAAITDAAVTTVTMRPYTDADIEAYILTGDPFDKAGAYAIQHAGFHPVARLDGCYCNVMGLPLWTVHSLLRRAFPNLAAPAPALDRCRACPLRSDAVAPSL